MARNYRYLVFCGLRAGDAVGQLAARSRSTPAGTGRPPATNTHSLGPTFIKVGQALSTRPDLIRKDFLEELIKLQDQLPPFDSARAFEIIEAELDRKISATYSEISPEPVAAASLGQVYRARLLTGEAVAVKVQRPNLLPVLSLDLYLMRWAAGWLARCCR